MRTDEKRIGKCKDEQEHGLNRTRTSRGSGTWAPVWAILMFLMVTQLASAQKVYRCDQVGKTMYSDIPCSTASAPSGSRPLAARTAAGVAATNSQTADSPYSTPYGEWRGQTQFQATRRTEPVADAHAVSATVVAISPAGKVTGASTETGCRMLGVASPGLVANILNLDVTLSGCRYDGFNRRFSGSLALYVTDKHAQLWLLSQDIGLGRIPMTYDIKATMRR